MAYLHCHGKMEDGTPCGWSQDDFWSDKIFPNGFEEYTPFRADLIKDLKASLFKDKIYMDKSFLEENQIPYKTDAEGHFCKGTDFVARRLEQRAKSIRNMLVRTYEEFKAKKETLACPRCGQRNWDID